MAISKYEDYLAAEVLSERRIVSYRGLSRALKVHSNVAKEMLYEFHRTSNARRSGAAHATYLLTGTRKSVKQTNGSQKQAEDSFMADSSFMSSSMPEQEADKPIKTTTITLVQEEELEAVQQLYEHITSIHIYSLQPGRLDNIHILSDCNRKIAADCSNEDPLENWERYGTIRNPLAKRRTNARPLPPTGAGPVPATAQVKAVPKPPAPEKPIAKPEQAPPGARRTSTSESKEEQAGKKIAGKATQLKRENSNLFKAFSKSKAPSKKDATGSDASAAPSPAPSGPTEDEPMKDANFSDDDKEFEEDFVMSDPKVDPAKSDALKQAKNDREAALRKMMEDDDDEPMGDTTENEGVTTKHSPPAGPTPDNQALQPQQPNELESELSQPQPSERRRGKRKVMKKKTTRDAEGYLVTKEEAEWESFSEEEPAPQPPPARKAKVPAVSTAGAGAATGTGDKSSKDKSKKGKQGQGSIMSFFGKK